MSAGAEITMVREGGRGAYFLPLPDSEPARVTFVETGPNHIAIDYSFVPPSHRGRGVALQTGRAYRRGGPGQRLQDHPPLRLCRRGNFATIPNGRTSWRRHGSDPPVLHRLRPKAGKFLPKPRQSAEFSNGCGNFSGDFCRVYDRFRESAAMPSCYTGNKRQHRAETNEAY